MHRYNAVNSYNKHYFFTFVTKPSFFLIELCRSTTHSNILTVWDGEQVHCTCRYHKQLFFFLCKGPCVEVVAPEDKFCGWYTWAVECPCLQHGAYGGGSYGWEVTGVEKWGGVCHIRLCLWPHVLIIRGKDSALSLLGQVTAWQAWHGTSR